jgi:hypothetical protein
MIVIDPASIKRVKDARKIIEDLQVRLMQCEMHLEDLARCAEIVQITNQFHLLPSFTAAANEYLNDKLEMPEQETGEMKIKIITDDKTVSGQPT